MLRPFYILLSLFILTGLILKGSSLAKERGENKREVIRGILYNASSFTPEADSLKKITEAYKEKAYERVIKLYQKLPPFTQIAPEEFLIVAESYFKIGDLDKALDLAERAHSLRRGTQIACEASLLKTKSLLILGKEKEALKELSGLEESYCKDVLEEKIELIKIYINQKGREGLDFKKYSSFIEEIFEAKINYLLKKGWIKEAEREIFNFLNLTGFYQRGKDFFYKLAEAYYEKGDISKAKKYYRLIITDWDPSKEAFFAKFRLYQIAYERAILKELLPPKTIEDLLLFISQIKTKYSEEKIAEEAAFLEVKIYFEKKDWERARKSAKEFFKRYEESSFRSKVRDYFCQASFNLVPEVFARGKISELQEIARNDWDLFKREACGDFYYALGSVFFNYKLYTQALYYLLFTYDINLSRKHLPDYYLKLAFLSLEKTERELSQMLFNYIKKTWKDTLKSKPEFLYLETYFALERDLTLGIKLLMDLLSSDIASYYKKNLLYKAFLQAVEAKKYNIALTLLQNPHYNATLKDYLVLLSDTLDKDPQFFEKLLREAKEKFPKNDKLLFLEAYHLERKGNLKARAELWGKLDQSKDWEGKLVQQYEKMQKLSERARNLVY